MFEFHRFCQCHNTHPVPCCQSHDLKTASVFFNLLRPWNSEHYLWNNFHPHQAMAVNCVIQSPKSSLSWFTMKAIPTKYNISASMTISIPVYLSYYRLKRKWTFNDPRKQCLNTLEYWNMVWIVFLTLLHFMSSSK